MRSTTGVTVEERRQIGKQARSRVARSGHAAWEPSDSRADPIALLEEQAVSRVQELVPIRYGRMLTSPFAFFRGAASIMASDLSTSTDSGLEAQLCGDAHLSNFGAYASAERELVFDVNDFDETHPGPWEWDVKRLAASFETAGRDRGFSSSDRSDVVVTLAETYRLSMADFAGKTELEVWYARMGVEKLLAELKSSLTKRQVKRTTAFVAKAQARDSLQAYNKLVIQGPDGPRIVSDPPLIVPLHELMTGADRDETIEELAEILSSYRKTLTTDRRHLLDQYHLVDFARKVVGVGSVGTRAFIMLLLGHDETDPLFLQVKEAQDSVLERFTKRSRYPNAGARVVAGQRLMQASSDIFLGWQRAKGADGIERDFYIRQLRDWKASADVDSMELSGMSFYAQMCGWTLARAHARSGDRIAISAYLGRGDVFDRALAAFAASYADQNERDFEVFEAAVASGRLNAERGV